MRNNNNEFLIIRWSKRLTCLFWPDFLVNQTDTFWQQQTMLCWGCTCNQKAIILQIRSQTHSLSTQNRNYSANRLSFSSVRNSQHTKTELLAGAHLSQQFSLEAGDRKGDLVQGDLQQGDRGTTFGGVWGGGGEILKVLSEFWLRNSLSVSHNLPISDSCPFNGTKTPFCSYLLYRAQQPVRESLFHVVQASWANSFKVLGFFASFLLNCSHPIPPLSLYNFCRRFW